MQQLWYRRMQVLPERGGDQEVIDAVADDTSCLLLENNGVGPIPEGWRCV